MQHKPSLIKSSYHVCVLFYCVYVYEKYILQQENKFVNVVLGHQLFNYGSFNVLYSWIKTIYLEMGLFFYVFLYMVTHPLSLLSACVCLSDQGPVLETTVGEDVNTMFLLNLLSGTEYSVQVMASYPAGQSQPLLVNAKTCTYTL